MYGDRFSFFKYLARGEVRKRELRQREKSESAIRKEDTSQKCPIDV